MRLTNSDINLVNIFDTYDEPIIIIENDVISRINFCAQKLLQIENVNEYLGKGINTFKAYSEPSENYFTYINALEFISRDTHMGNRFKFKHMTTRGEELDTEIVIFDLTTEISPIRYGILIYDLTDFNNEIEILSKDDKKLFESLLNPNLIILVIEPDTGDILDCSQQACLFYGYSKSIMTSMNISNINTLDRNEIKLEMEKATSGRRNHFSFVHKLSNGEVRNVGVVSGPIVYKNRVCLYSIVEPLKPENQTKLIRNNTKIFEEIYDKLPFACLIMDKNCILIKINDVFTEAFEFDESEAIGKSVMDLIVPVEYTEESTLFQRVVNSGNSIEKDIFRKTKSGQIKPYKLHAYPLYKDDMVIGTVAIYQDIKEYKEIKQRLKVIERIYENVDEGMIITDKNSNIIWLNKSFADITGYDREELLGKNPRILKSGKQDSVFYQNMWYSINKTGSWKGEIYDKRKDETIFPQWLTILKVENELDGNINYIGVTSDISELKSQQEKIREMAYKDNLTMLYNRSYLLEHGDDAIIESTKLGYGASVLFIDLDKFKEINDTFGHKAGDNVLRVISSRMRTALKSSDLIARVGGDEFVIILGKINNRNHAVSVMDRIVESVIRPINISGMNHRIDVSIGVAEAPHDGRDIIDLINKADKAMYKAKSIPGSTYEFYLNPENKNEEEKFGFMNLSVEDIAKELDFYFQGIIDVFSKKIIGAEALIRWINPIFGTVGPDVFLDKILKPSSSGALLKWELNKVAQSINKIKMAGIKDIKISINLTADQMEIPKLRDIFMEAVNTNDLDTTMLEVEITEDMYIKNLDKVRSNIFDLERLGITITIDDFGKGYSSLASIQELKMSKIKIDKSFIDGLPNSQKSIQLVSTMLIMAKNLNVKVVAEGVENKDQYEFLRFLGCDYIQGFHFYEPSTIDEFIKSVKQNGIEIEDVK